VDHERIWAPWRLAYIVGDQQTPKSPPDAKVLPGGDSSCFFCQDVAQGDDRQRLIVERGEHSITMLNRYPYNNGHLLVAPRRHVARLDQIDSCEQLDLTNAIGRMIHLLERVLKPEGFNVGMNLGRIAGAGVPGHLHWHIVPRWSGDTNFMPVVAGIRVIPQSLEALWEVLDAELRAMREEG
jgi:ATP adenylyltransferase